MQSRGATGGALAAAWRARAEAFLYTGRLKAARSAYEKACAFATSADENALLGQILVGRIGTLLVMGDFRAAEGLVPTAGTLLRASGDEDYLRRLHVNVGSGFYHRERYAEAAASMSEALALMERAGQHDAVWAALMLNYGIALSQLARVGEAREAFRRTESFGREHGQSRMVAQALFNRGALEALRGGYRDALRLLGEAEETFAEQGVQELLAASHLEQAQIHIDLAMPAEGRALAERAAGAFQAEGMLLDAELARLAESRSLLLLGRSREAIQRLEESERFYRARRLPARRVETLLHLARARTAEGGQDAALRAAGDALRIARRIGIEGLECEARVVRADLQRQRGEAAKAEQTLVGFSGRVARLPARARREFWSAAARAAAARGDTASAERHYRRAIRALEAERALIPGIELRAHSFEASVRVFHDKIALVASLRRPSLDRVLTLMERARGRTFRELLASRGQTADDAVTERRAVLGSVMRRLDHIQMDAQAVSMEEAESLRRQILALEREITARARRRDASSRTAPEATGRGSLDGAAPVVAALRRGEVLIEYFVLEDRILAAVLTRERRFLATLPVSPADLARRLNHMRLQLESLAATASRPVGNPAFLRRSAEARLEEFHRLLVAPLLERAGADCDAGGREGGRLTIVPHDLLHQVPFECLHDGTAYLDERWEITRCPTADFLVERRARPRTRGAGGALVIAGTRTGSPFILEEARRVAAAWGGEARPVLADPSPAGAREAMRSAAMIHVSAHGTFRADNPLFSTLHIGPEVLFLADILETPLEAELAVLSACNTGQTFSGRGDALLGVAHAFLVAGAGELVASLWRVHDRATADWMDAFHASLRASGDAPAARRHASRAVREAWPHPFYWGGFCVLGA